jgi:ketosteroid isomerase-like protein
MSGKQRRRIKAYFTICQALCQREPVGLPRSTHDTAHGFARTGETNMDQDRQAVEQLLNQFALHADRHDANALGRLFLAHGKLCMAGTELHGSAEIADFCQQRFQGGSRMTRHSWSNLSIARRTPDELVSSIVQITYEQVDGASDMQVRVNDVFDRFSKDEEGRWRFSERVIKRIMSVSGPSA